MMEPPQRMGERPMATTTTKVSAVEYARRRSAVDEARHSSEMEGGRSTPEGHADQEAYVAGEISVDQLVEQTRSRHGLG